MGLLRRTPPSRTITLPPEGRALVLSDLHGHLGDFEAFLQSSRLEERLRAGEPLWLILTGDVPDVERHRSVDRSVPSDGDVQILERLIRLRADLGPRGDRVVYLEGNHDFHLSRIAREVAAFAAAQRGETPRWDGPPPRLTQGMVEDYFAYYLSTYGEAVFQNNIGPYDMIFRVEPHHVAFLESAPILAVCGASGVLVTHAGPPHMAGWKPRALKKEIEGADRTALRLAEPEAYYASPYHQLLNGRFKNNDYTLDDLSSFLEAYEGTLLVTGHTPHPYLVDFQRRAPLAGCSFRDGLGLIGGQQVVLCSSFGAFHPALKRYLEFDLSRRLPHVEALFEARAVQPIWSVGRRPPDAAPLPGADVVLGLSAVQARGDLPSLD